MTEPFGLQGGPGRLEPSRIRSLIEDARDFRDRLAGKPLRPRILRPNRWSIPQAEAAIRRAPVEWAFVFDANEKQIGRSRGDAIRVTIDPRLLARVGDKPAAAADGTLVHNRPPNLDYPPTSLLRRPNPPSAADIALFVDGNLAELVLVTEDWRYVVARPADGWYGDGDLYAEQFRVIRGTLIEEVSADALAEAPSDEAKSLLVQHLVCTLLARQGWFRYQRALWAEERP